MKRFFVYFLSISAVVLTAQEPKKNHGVAPDANPAAPAVVKQAAPKGDVCSPDFLHDARYFEDPTLQPLLDAIEKAQHERGVSLYRAANEGRDGGKPAFGWIGLIKHLNGSDPSGKKTADDREFADWALYLHLSGPAGLGVFQSYDRNKVTHAVSVEGGARATNAAAPAWFKELPLRKAADPASGIDWDTLLSDESKVQSLYDKVFHDNKLLPGAQEKLSGWRTKVADPAEIAKLGLDKLSYFELTVLKEHLLNRFDAHSAEQVDWEYDEAVRPGSPLVNDLPLFGKPPVLSGEARRARRLAERKQACLQQAEVMRNFADYTSRYSAQLDAKQKLVKPGELRRHGLPLEFRAGLNHFLDGTVEGKQIWDAVKVMLAPPAKDLLKPDTIANGFSSNALTNLLYTCASDNPFRRIEYYRVANRPAANPGEEKKKNDELDLIDNATRLSIFLRTGARRAEVKNVEDLLGQYGRKLTDAERNQLLRMSSLDFDEFRNLVHGIAGARRDTSSTAYAKQLFNTHVLPIFKAKGEDRGGLVRGLDFLDANGGVRFDPSKLDKLEFFPPPPVDAGFNAGQWLFDQNQRILDHFTALVRDEATAKARFPKSGQLFHAYDDLYRARYGQSLSDVFCGKTPCDEARAGQATSDAEVLAVARLMRMEQLAKQHPNVAPAELPPGMTGERLRLAKRAQRLQYEHDLLQEELKRINGYLAECHAKPRPNCVQQEVNDAKTALWQQTFRDLERERAVWHAEGDKLANELNGEAQKNLQLVRGLEQGLIQMQGVLAHDAFGHVTATPKVKSGVGFDREAYLTGKIPLTAPERDLSPDQGRIPHTYEGFVSLYYPTCPPFKDYVRELHGVPEEILQSPLAFRAYMKRRAMITLLKDNKFSDDEITEVLNGKRIATDKGEKLKWDAETLGKRIKYHKTPNEIRRFLENMPDKCNTLFSQAMPFIAWLQLTRGDSKEVQEMLEESRTIYEQMDAAIDRIFGIDGVRVRVSYHNAPAALKNKAMALEQLPDDQIRDQVRALATGTAADRKHFADLLSYFERYPINHPVRSIVYGPSVPEHLREAFEKDPCLTQKPKTELCLRELWEASSPEFQEREHALRELGLHKTNEKPEDLRQRLRDAAEEARRKATGGSGRAFGDKKDDIPANAGLRKGEISSPTRDIVFRSMEFWMKKAIAAPTDSEFETYLASPYVSLESLDRDGRKKPGVAVPAINEAKMYFMLNLMELRRLREGKAPLVGLEERVEEMISTDGKIDAKKAARMEELLKAAIYALEGDLKRRGGALIDPVVAAISPMESLKSELEELERNLLDPHPPQETVTGVLPGQAKKWMQTMWQWWHLPPPGGRGLQPPSWDRKKYPSEDKYGNRLPPAADTLSFKLAFGLRECDEFLLSLDGKIGGFNYNGIPGSSRNLISKLPRQQLDLLQLMCTYRESAAAKGQPISPTLDKEIAETVLAAWPGKLLHTLMKPENGVLREVYAAEISERLRVQMRSVIEIWEDEVRRSGVSNKVTLAQRMQDPEYRVLAILSGAYREEPLWAEAKIYGFGDFLRALPKMSFEAKTKFRDWTTNELIAQYPDLAQLRNLPIDKLRERLIAELAADNMRNDYNEDKKAPHHNFAKSYLVMMLALLDESGNDVRGVEAAQLDASLGGPLRFSPLEAAIQAAERREKFPPPVTVVIPAKDGKPAVVVPAGPPPKLNLSSELEELRLIPQRIADGQSYFPTADERNRRYNLARGDAAAMQKAREIYRNYNYANLERLSPQDRDQLRKLVTDELEYCRTQRNQSAGLDASKLQCNIEVQRALRDLYNGTLKALDHLDAKDGRLVAKVPEKDPNADPLKTGPSGSPDEKGHWVEAPKPKAPELPKAVIDFHNLITSRDKTYGLARVCDPGAAALSTPYQAQAYVRDLDLHLRTFEKDKKAAQEAFQKLSPQMPVELDQFLDNLRLLGNVASLTDSMVLNAPMRKTLAAIGFQWGREDITDPLIAKPELLADAGARAKALAGLKTEHAAFKALADKAAVLNHALPEWRQKFEATFEAGIAALENADPAKREPLRKDFLTKLQAARDFIRYQTSYPEVNQRLGVLRDRCFYLMGRNFRRINGYDPENPEGYSPARLRVNRMLAESGVNPTAGVQSQSYYLLTISPFTSDWAKVREAVAALKKMRDDYQKEPELRAELTKLNPGLADSFPKYLDQLIARGEEGLRKYEKAENPAGRLLLSAGGLYGDGQMTRRPYFELVRGNLPNLNQVRALELQREIDADVETLQKNKTAREQLDALDPTLHAALLDYNLKAQALLKAYTASKKPSEDAELQTLADEADKARLKVWEVSRKLGEEKLTMPGVEPLRESGRKFRDDLYAALMAERKNAHAPKWVAEAPAPRPAPVPGGKKDEVPVQVGAIPVPPELGEKKQPQQLQKILELLNAHGAGLNDGQRTAILTREAEVNQILIDLYPLMHDTLPKQGYQGLPEWWRRLAQNGSMGDIRQARAILMPAYDESQARGEVSLADYRRDIRDEIRRTGKLSPAGLEKLQRLAQVEVVQKWLPERLREVFSSIDPETAKALLKRISEQQEKITADLANKQLEQLRREVAVETGEAYVAELAKQYPGDAKAQFKAREDLRRVLALLHRDPKEKQIHPDEKALLVKHADFLKQMRTIYDVDVVREFGESFDEVKQNLKTRIEADEPGKRDERMLEALDLAERRFLPRLQAKADELVKQGHAPLDALEEAYAQVMKEPEFAGHQDKLASVREDMQSRTRKRWNGIDTSSRTFLLQKHIETSAQSPRAAWCATAPDAAWKQWDAKQKQRAATFERSKTGKDWEEYRKTSRLRTNALLGQQTMVTDRIQRLMQDIDITTRKIKGIDELESAPPEPGKKKSEWEELTTDQQNKYRRMRDYLRTDLQARRANLETAYRDLRKVQDTFVALKDELKAKHDDLLGTLTQEVFQKHNAETARQEFLTGFVSDSVGNKSKDLSQDRAAILERYFDWRERADLLGRSFAESGVAGDAWRTDPRLAKLLDEVKDNRDSCAVAPEQATALVQAALESQRTIVAQRKAELDKLAYYGIKWNGSALDFDDFFIPADDKKTPQQRMTELRDILNRLGTLLPQGSKDPALNAFTNLVQGTYWQQFEARLLLKWNSEGRRPQMEWFNPGKIEDPQKGAAIAIKQNADGTYDFELRPLQEVRDEASKVAAALRKRVRDHATNLKRLREESNHLFQFLYNIDQYHHALDANLAAIGPDVAELRKYGGIAVQLAEEDRDGKPTGKKTAPLPANTIADHSELEFTHEMHLDVAETMRNIIHDENWRLAQWTATVVVCGAALLSGVGVFTLPALASTALHGAALGLGLAFGSAFVTQDALPQIGAWGAPGAVFKPSERTFSELGPEAYKSAATFALGNVAAKGVGALAEWRFGARLMAGEATTTAGAAWNGFGRIVSNPVAQQMIGVGGAHFGVHMTWDLVEAGLEGRKFYWDEKLGEHTAGAAQTAAYMWGPDQRAAGFLRSWTGRVAASVAVNQSLSAAMNGWGMYRQFTRMEAEANAAEKAGNESKAKALRAQLAEAKKWEKVLSQLGKSAVSELPTHVFFGMQAAKAAGNQGLVRDFVRTKDPGGADSLLRLRQRAAAEQAKANGPPAKDLGNGTTDRGDAAIGGGAAAQVPQYRVNELVKAAQADPKSPAAEAVDLLAAHYRMSRERFIEVWGEWVKSGKVKGTRPLGTFDAGQAARMGNDKKLKPEARDLYGQSTGFLEHAEGLVRRDLNDAHAKNDPRKVEQHLAELLALRPDSLQDKAVTDVIPVVELLTAAKAGTPLSKEQSLIVAHLATAAGFDQADSMASFLRLYQPKPGTPMKWDNFVEALVHSSGSDPVKQAEMIKDERLSAEGIGLVWGPVAYRSAIEAYLIVYHPKADHVALLQQFQASGKPFKDFIKTVP